VKSITATFVLKAYGASSHNGFGFTLPTLKTNDVLSVSGYDVINNSVLTLRAMGSKMVKPTIIVLMTLTESCLQERRYRRKYAISIWLH
jgi:hypothetical protein